jgi:Galactose oxidase, central domain
LNPTPGVVTAKQAAAGCTAPDDWVFVSAAGGVNPTAGSFFPGLVYDTANKKVILFGGYAGGPGAAASETWAYDVPTRTWTNRNPSNGPKFVWTPMNVVGTPLTYNPGDGKIYLLNGSVPAETWAYDYGTNKWTMICNNCSTPANPYALSYDAKNNLLVGLNYGGVQNIEAWELTLSGTPPPPPPPPQASCDQNKDGVTNVIDVQLAIPQALGTAACSTADLNGDGACTILDVQRIITAALGGVCQIGN